MRNWSLKNWVIGAWPLSELLLIPNSNPNSGPTTFKSDILSIARPALDATTSFCLLTLLLFRNNSFQLQLSNFATQHFLPKSFNLVQLELMAYHVQGSCQEVTDIKTKTKQFKDLNSSSGYLTPLLILFLSVCSSVQTAWNLPKVGGREVLHGGLLSFTWPYF